MVQSKVKAKSQSHVTTDGQSIQYVLVPSSLGIKGVPSEQISIRHQEEYLGVSPLYNS
jgi:hypothetical protein